MRRLLILLFVVLPAMSVVQAQSLDAFKEHLAAPVSSGMLSGPAQVLVTEFGDVPKIVAQATKSNSRLHFRGFRVCIFFDNGQDARAGAVAAKSFFETTYPGTSTYMVYENPYFKVTVGNCFTAEEAIILKGRISATFPKAFLKSEELSITDLLN